MPENELIVQIGEALYGERWQAEMARALDVHRDTVQDWRQGRSTPRPGVYADLAQIVKGRRAALGEIADRLARQITLPVATATVNSDFLGYAATEADALMLIRDWMATLPAETAARYRVTGVTIGPTRWNCDLNGQQISRAYIPVARSQ